MYPKLTLDLTKLQQNMAAVVDLCRPYGISVFGVTKVCCGWPEVGRALLAGGAVGLADSRMANLVRLREAGLGPLMLLRSPAPQQAAQVVETADISLNSEKAVLQALNSAAEERGIVHRVLLMVDLGEMREGVWDGELLGLYSFAQALPHIEVWGVGANFSCLNGSPPWQGQLEQLAQLARSCGAPNLVVSGGNSSALHLIRRGLWQGEWTAAVNNLRIGESVFLGWDLIDKTPLPGCHQEVCRLEAEVIEVQDKQVGGKWVRRAVVALGKQDIGTGTVWPLCPGTAVVGVTSDHLVLDVSQAPDTRVGDVAAFGVDYWALLGLFTSPYVRKEELR